MSSRPWPYGTILIHHFSAKYPTRYPQWLAMVLLDHGGTFRAVSLTDPGQLADEATFGVGIPWWWSVPEFQSSWRALDDPPF